MPRTRISFEMRQKARALRVHATKAEGLLWAELRTLKAEGMKFRRQAAIGPYIVDFACLNAKLIVEVDGDWHEAEKAKRHDANRDAYLWSLGFTLMRVDEPDVLHSAWHVAQAVKRKVEHCRIDPTRPLRGHPPLKGQGNRIWVNKPRIFRSLDSVGSPNDPILFMHMRLPCLKGEGETAPDGARP